MNEIASTARLRKWQVKINLALAPCFALPSLEEKKNQEINYGADIVFSY